MFYMVPSWTGFLNMQSVGVIGAYVVSYALFESVIFLLLLTLMALILPARFFCSNFVPVGSAMTVILAFAAYLLQRKMRVVRELSLIESIVYPAVVLIGIIAAIILLAYIFQRYAKISELVQKIADLMIVFALLYVPLGIIGLLVVIYRNVF